MTKAEAAATLGVSTRAIERYMAKGTLPVRYEPKPGGGQVAVFDAAHVEALKRQMERPDRPDTPTKKLARRTVQRSARPDAHDTTLRHAAIKQALMPGITKPTGSITEAVAVSGCSERLIKAGIAEGAIHADRRGPSGTVRIDLEDVIDYARRSIRKQLGPAGEGKAR